MNGRFDLAKFVNVAKLRASQFRILITRRAVISTQSCPSMIRLSNQLPFASGCKRDCYVHPHNPDLVVKIIPPDRSIQVLHSKKLWLRRMLQTPESMDANRGEREKFEQLHNRFDNLQEAIPYLVEYHGQVQTDLGEGLVFQAIKNYDGTMSETIVSAVKTGGYSRTNLLEALKFLTSIRGDSTIYNDVGKNNLVIQVLDSKHSKYKLWVIDGINCRALIPITEHFSMYARVRKAKKIWKVKRYIQKNFPAA